MVETKKQNILGTGNIKDLMVKFAVPSIIAMLVGSIYNIVDQIFIGNVVGTLGNAATNIAFPINTLCISLALLFGIGGAAAFNLHMGAGKTEEAPYYIGNALGMLIISGLVIMTVVEIFLVPLLKLCGSPEEVLPFAMEYVRVTAIGFPFMIVTAGGGHLIRADGRPQITMLCNISGAVINVFLDALFVVVLRWGMFGAAFATVIGQVFSGILSLWFISRYKTVKLSAVHFIPKLRYFGHAASLGLSNFSNQIAMMFVNVVFNNLLRVYGASSIYGETIPIACSGIVAKVTMLYFSIVIGIAQGAQPIESFNYGAKQYKRVKKTYLYAVVAVETVSVAAYLLFQIFPRQILAMFGQGTELYFEFGIRYFHTFLFFAFLNGMQPVTSNFLAAIGKAYKGMFLALTRQILFLLPMLLVLPIFFGIYGLMYAGLIGDGLAFIVAVLMARAELKKIDQMSEQKRSIEDMQ